MILLIVQEAIQCINVASDSGKLSDLLRALQSEDANIGELNPQNIRWYSEVLNKTRKQNIEVCDWWVWSMGVALIIITVVWRRQRFDN